MKIIQPIEQQIKCYLLVRSGENVLFDVLSIKEKCLHFTDRFADNGSKGSPENGFKIGRDRDKTLF